MKSCGLAKQIRTQLVPGYQTTSGAFDVHGALGGDSDPPAEPMPDKTLGYADTASQVRLGNPLVDHKIF